MPVLADYDESVGEASADTPPAACPQTPFRLGFVMGEELLPQSEDCHFLNIYTPSRTGSRPVLVWLHGGAYIAGSSEEQAYNGSLLSEEGDLVVVTVSYRLGIFGYLYDPDQGIANLGLHDQMTALRWVHRYISSFGGDPQRVTLAGQSAGAHSIAAIISHCHEPLLHQAIIQSMPAIEASEKDAVLLHQLLQKHCPVPLREATVSQLLEAQTAAMAASPSMMPFGPCPADIWGKPAVPSLSRVLITYQAQDALPFVAMRLNGMGWIGRSLQPLISKIATRKVFRAAATRYARHLNRYDIDTRIVKLNWKPDDSPLGACHCLELSLLFGSWSRWQGVPMLGSTTKAEWERRSSDFRRQWAAFVRWKYIQ